MNDLPSSLSEIRTHLYADDTAISVSSNNVEQLVTSLNVKLQDAASWMHENRLTLNMTKTKTMLFGTHQSIPKTRGAKVMAGDTDIETVNAYR